MVQNMVKQAISNPAILSELALNVHKEAKLVKRRTGKAAIME